MELPKLTPRKLVNVLFDEYHSESWSVSRARTEEIQPDYPENSSYARAAALLTAREFVVARNLDRPIDPAILENLLCGCVHTPLRPQKRTDDFSLSLAVTRYPLLVGSDRELPQ